MNVSALSPALATAARALRTYGRQVDRAAQDIARAGLPVAADATGDAGPAEVMPANAVDLAEAEVRMLVAQRAFQAQLRTIRVADEMLTESIRLGETNAHR